MTAEQIEKFFSSNVKSNSLVRISFKTRNAVVGIFVQTPDFDELKLKNFWRIVSEANYEQWKQSKIIVWCACLMAQSLQSWQLPKVCHSYF
jgi:hypothetical protein